MEYNFFRNYVLYATAASVNGKDNEKDEYLLQIPSFNGSFELKVPIENYFDVDLSANFLQQTK